MYGYIVAEQTTFVARLSLERQCIFFILQIHIMDIKLIFKMLKYTFGKYIREIIIDTIEQIGYTNCRTSRRC